MEILLTNPPEVWYNMDSATGPTPMVVFLPRQSRPLEAGALFLKADNA